MSDADFCPGAHDTMMAVKSDDSTMGYHPQGAMSPHSLAMGIISPPTSFHIHSPQLSATYVDHSTTQDGAAPGGASMIPIPSHVQFRTGSPCDTPLSGVDTLFSEAQATSPCSSDGSYIFLTSPMLSNCQMPPLLEEPLVAPPPAPDTTPLPPETVAHRLANEVTSTDSNPDITGVFQMSDINVSVPQDQSHSSTGAAQPVSSDQQTDTNHAQTW